MAGSLAGCRIGFSWLGTFSIVSLPSFLAPSAFDGRPPFPWYVTRRTIVGISKGFFKVTFTRSRRLDNLDPLVARFWAWGGMVGTSDAPLLRICNAAYMHGIIEHYLAASENLMDDVTMITDNICSASLIVSSFCRSLEKTT
jgi:hypothetical protein